MSSSDPYKGDMSNLLEDWHAHMVDVHDDTDFGRRVMERHDERYPDCPSRPSLKGYKFLGPRRELTAREGA